MQTERVQDFNHGWTRGLFGLFGSNAERDPTVQWQCFDLDVEAVAVCMCPGCADARPVAFFRIPVANMVGDVAGGFGSCGWFLRVSHVKSPFVSRLRQSRPDGTKEKSLSAGAK